MSEATSPSTDPHRASTSRCSCTRRSAPGLYLKDTAPDVRRTCFVAAAGPRSTGAARRSGDARARPGRGRVRRADAAPAGRAPRSTHAVAAGRRSRSTAAATAAPGPRTVASATPQPAARRHGAATPVRRRARTPPGRRRRRRAAPRRCSRSPATTRCRRRRSWSGSPGSAPDELDAVHAYEAAHRQRRTILGKIEQLAGLDAWKPRVRRPRADLAALVELAQALRAELRDERGGALWETREAHAEPLDDALAGAARPRRRARRRRHDRRRRSSATASSRSRTCATARGSA